ncbi:SET domain-containing protein [Calocera viscosa TUFC12733]|uniref:SET domain-containing protein n=1 Tax=Calocera viscosa (strain TUFC12733) TaxID=1330018 RepID=A0A167MLI9_CALVF|nr:SET domain-containing protein [Calocera viscosa TUFC12733]
MSFDRSAIPAPTRLELEIDDDVAHAAFRQQGLRTVVANMDDPFTRRAAQSEVAVLGYGRNADFTDWDTMCITYAENRLHLMNHIGFDKYMSAELTKFVSMSVEVVEIPRKGLGLRATRDIPRGQTFVVERPLLTCMGTMDPYIGLNFDKLIQKGMSPEHREAYYKLHNCKSKASGMIESLSIMRSNALAAEWAFDKSEPQRAVFEITSRANHSCVPNATYDWSFPHFTGGLRSLVPIKKGEEVTLSYTGKMFEPASERRAELLEQYAFECTCPSCTLSQDRQKKSDARRVALGKRYALHREDKFFDQMRIELGYDDSYIVETLNMCDAEGLVEQRADMMVAYAQFEAMRANLTGDLTRAEELAKRAIKEIKKIGFRSLWEAMDEIVEKKKTADGGPKKPNLLEMMKHMNLEQLEQLQSGPSSSTSNPRSVLQLRKNMSQKQRQKAVEKTKLILQHMLMVEVGAKVVRRDF